MASQNEQNNVLNEIMQSNQVQNSQDSQSEEKIIKIPGDGNCLFSSIFFAFLEPVKNNIKEFKKRFSKLTGATDYEYFQYEMSKNNHIENYRFFKPVINKFRNRVVNYMQKNNDDFKPFILEGQDADLNSVNSREREEYYHTKQHILDDEEQKRKCLNYYYAMEKDGTYGGYPEIIASAHLLETEISIFEPEIIESDGRIRNTIIKPNDINTSNCIKLVRENQNHYNYCANTYQTDNNNLPTQLNEKTINYYEEIKDEVEHLYSNDNDLEFLDNVITVYATELSKVSNVEERDDLKKTFIDEINSQERLLNYFNELKQNTSNM